MLVPPLGRTSGWQPIGTHVYSLFPFDQPPYNNPDRMQGMVIGWSIDRPGEDDDYEECPLNIVEWQSGEITELLGDPLAAYYRVEGEGGC